MRFFVLVNDYGCENNCEKEHGLSLYIEALNKKILMDVGQSNIFLQNAEKLNIDISSIDYLVLSHGHHDHGKGLKNLENTGLPFYCHPECFISRFRKRDTSFYAGIGTTQEELSKKFDVTLSKESLKISDGIYFLGEIERKNNFEAKTTPLVLEDGKDDWIYDDSGIAIVENNELIVVSGCAHSGICNTIEYAKKVTGANKVKAVIGGFHLKEINDATNKTIDYFKKEKIEYIFMGHCTSPEVCDEFEKILNDVSKITNIQVGGVYTI